MVGRTPLLIGWEQSPVKCVPFFLNHSIANLCFRLSVLFLKLWHPRNLKIGDVCWTLKRVQYFTKWFLILRSTPKSWRSGLECSRIGLFTIKTWMEMKIATEILKHQLRWWAKSYRHLGTGIYTLPILLPSKNFDQCQMTMGEICI